MRNISIKMAIDFCEKNFNAELSEWYSHEQKNPNLCPRWPTTDEFFLIASKFYNYLNSCE